MFDVSPFAHPIVNVSGQPAPCMGFLETVNGNIQKEVARQPGNQALFAVRIHGTARPMSAFFRGPVQSL
jgi:hypothetical protein